MTNLPTKKASKKGKKPRNVKSQESGDGAGAGVDLPLNITIQANQQDLQSLEGDKDEQETGMNGGLALFSMHD